MIRLRIFINEIGPDGELTERLAAELDVRGQQLEFTAGDSRLVQVGMPVYSAKYGRLIDFDTDGEEWARNLPSAYRSGALYVTAEEVADPGASQHVEKLPAMAFAYQHRT